MLKMKIAPDKLLKTNRKRMPNLRFQALLSQFACEGFAWAALRTEKGARLCFECRGK